MILRNSGNPAVNFSLVGLLFPIYEKTKNVPNHQSVYGTAIHQIIPVMPQ
jgi:hypothetical protein